jgi:exodeoxyribonuclease-1
LLRNLFVFEKDDLFKYERVFTKIALLNEGESRIPLKTIHLNKSPMLASLNVLDEAAASRLQINKTLCEKHWQQINAKIA